MKGKEKRSRKSETKDRNRRDYSRYHFSAGEGLKYGLFAAALTLFVSWVCYQSWYALPVGAGVSFVFLQQIRKDLAENRRKQLEGHFKSVLASIHTGMLAGYSLENAVKTAGKEAEELYGSSDDLVIELRELLWQMECQRPVENLFYEMGVRTGVSSVLAFGEVLMIAKRTGGSMRKVLEDTWRNLSERIDTEAEIATVIAAKRYEQNVMCVMPAVILVYLRLTFRGFLDPLYGNAAGILIMSAGLAMYMAAYLWGRSIVSIRV